MPFDKIVRLDGRGRMSPHVDFILETLNGFEGFRCILDGSVSDGSAYAECLIKVPEVYAEKALAEGLDSAQAFAKLALESHGVMVLPQNRRDDDHASGLARFQVIAQNDLPKEQILVALNDIHKVYKNINKKYGRARPSIIDKTPTPCKKEYSKDFLEAAALQHISRAKEGNEPPHLILLFGGSGAGKGTFIRHIERSGLDIKNFVFNGLDEYLEYLPEYRQSLSNPKEVYKDAADDCYGGGSIPLAKIAGAEIIKRKQHVVYEDTGKNLKRTLERVLPPYEGAGYRVTLVLVDNDPEVAKSRSIDRFLVEGRYAPPDYIEGSFKNVPENFATLLTSGRVAEAVYCDNSCTEGGRISAAETERLLHMQLNCLKCWREEPVSPAAFQAGDKLIPDKALYEGKPVYFKKHKNQEL